MVQRAEMTSSSVALVGPAHPVPMKRKIAAILAADVAGYSRLVAENEERTLTELAAARQVFDSLIAPVGGRIFNTAGDSVMVEFDSAVEALRAAVDIQNAMKARNAGIEPRRRLEFRMGLTIGDVVERNGDLLGDGVNIAARLEGLAPAGGICVSRSVHEAVSNKLAVSFRELGPRQVKNIPQPVFAYVIEPPNTKVWTAEPLVARRASAEAEPMRGWRDAGREADEEQKARRGGFFGVLVRSLLMTAAILTLIMVGIPVLKLARESLLASHQPAQTEIPVETAEKPPANESGVPVPPPQPPATPVVPAEKPVQGEKSTPAPQPTQPAPPPQAKPPQRAERPKPAPRPETPRPEASARPEPSRPEPARPEPPRTEPPRAEPSRPADPAAAYASMAREGLLPEPRTLAEHYHNARFLEGRGDRNGALAAYAAAAPMAGEYLDVHFRYASLLRSLRGTAAVRQAYTALQRTNPTLAAELVIALSYEGDERRAKIEAFAASHPDMAAVDNLLADALLDPREGEPTLTDRRLAFDASDRFVDAAASGELNGRFVDRAFLDAWVEGAKRRRGDVERFFASGRVRPSVAFTRVANGWSAKLTLPEPASAISVRVGERGQFTSTGFSNTMDSKTGKPLPNLEFEMPNGTPRATLYLTYQDRSGREAGPFPLAFDPGTATVDAGRSALERFPDSWVTFRDDLPDVLSYATLVGNRCSLSRATIGFGDEAPRRPLPLPPCDQNGPTTMPSGSSLLTMPDGTDAVQVQLVFTDGTESPVRTFRRP
jgi:class 3 adenylate cyclase